MLVYDSQVPKRTAWEMSKEGYEGLNRKYPGRYRVKEEPKIVVVEKKRPVVVESPVINVTPISRVIPPTRKEKKGKS